MSKSASMIVTPKEMGNPKGMWVCKVSVREMQTVDGKGKLVVKSSEPEGRNRAEAWSCGLQWLAEQEHP